MRAFLLCAILSLLHSAKALVFGSRVPFARSTRSAQAGQRTVTAMAASLTGKPLVSVEEALQAHGDANVIFIDGSSFLKDRNGRAEYEAGPRIAGAKYFDIDDVASKGPELNPRGIKHMMPPKRLFAAAMDAMGISNANHLIVYGTKGCFFMHRTWTQFRAMGHDHDRAHLMQGSLDDWKAAGGPIEEGPTKVLVADELDLTKEPSYVATDPQNVVNLEEMKKIVQDGSAIVVDVRDKVRFLGQVEEPRPGLRLGRMPGAINLPFIELLNPDNVVQYKPTSELMARIEEAGLDINTEKPIVVSCGSGVTACALVVALTVCGRDPSKTLLYDGSWMEWGGEPDTPIVKDE